jgi:hypothetical protein
MFDDFRCDDFAEDCVPVTILPSSRSPRSFSASGISSPAAQALCRAVCKLLRSRAMLGLLHFPLARIVLPSMAM